MSTAPRKRNTLLIGAAIAAGFVALCCVGSLFTSGRRPAATGGAGGPTSAPAAAAVATAPPVAYGVGQDVKVGDVRWKFLEAVNAGDALPKGDTSAGDFAPEAKTSGAYIKVRLEIENQGADQLTFTSVDLKDAKGRTFKSSTDFNVTMHAPDWERCTFEQLNPNIVKTCTLYFEVAGDASGLSAIVGDLAPLGADDVAISLGL